MQPEEITPFALTTFESLKKRLPPEISNRLKCSRHVRRHGSASSVYLFNIWDKNQVGFFDSKHFSYCLGYDPLHRYSPTTWYLHLWMNTIRIYQYSAEIKSALESIISKQRPPSFTPHSSAQASEAVVRCSTFSGRLNDFENYFLPLYDELIGSIHPYLMPIIDSFTYDLSSEQQAEVIRSRSKFYIGPKKRLSPEAIRTYSRSIPSSWRAQLLEKSRFHCSHCNVPVTTSNVHIDHICPFSKGGLTVISNLQALCSRCNLKKGNRSLV